MTISRNTSCLTLFAVSLLAGCGGSDRPAIHVQPAAGVIGQADFRANLSFPARPVAANTIDGPSGSPVVQDGVLYLSDYNSNRVLGFNALPVSNGAGADFALGQPDLISSDYGAGANQMDGPQSVRYGSGKLFVDDTFNNRILIWNTPPKVSGTPADVVVGQAGFGAGDPGAGASGLDNPEDIFVVSGKLIVADSGNNRVLIWSSIPTNSGVPADLVLGQGGFGAGAYNDDNQDGTPDAAPSSRTLSYPAGIWSDGTKLIVCDGDNNRVLIWNSFPTTNFAPADLVLGQADFTRSAANDDNQDGIEEAATSARSFNFPYSVTSDGNQLFVADYANNRVLMWRTMPSAGFAPAEGVFGQTSFTSRTADDDNQDGKSDATPGSGTLDYPAGVYLYGGKLLVTDNNNNRYQIFDF